MPRKKYTSQSIAIPTFWTGDEALGFVAFLDQIITATWAAHGDSMAAQLQRHQRVRPAVRLTVLREFDEESESDLPF